MQLQCPFCGLRDEAEFNYGGDAALSLLPTEGESTSAWLDRVYLRDNPRGQHTELWFHAAGCQQWLRVKRSTTTHTIASVRVAGPTGETEAA